MTPRTIANSRLVDGAKLDDITVTSPINLDTIPASFAWKQDTLVAWTNIIIAGNVISSISGSGNGNNGASAKTHIIATDGQTVFTTSFTYIPWNGNLLVFINWVLQTLTSDYTETNSTTVTLTSPLALNDVVDIVYPNKGLNWKGSYSWGTTYIKDDWVAYGGSSYICIATSIGNLPTNGSYFSLLASIGNTWATGSTGSTGSTWATGNGIASVTLLSTVGLVKTYRITFTDSTHYDFVVNDWATGSTGSTGATGATWSAWTNGTNGRWITSVTLTSGTHAPWTLDTYTITFTDATTSTFQVYNGADWTGWGGSVTSVSVVSAHGLSWSVANPTTTPAITLSTNVTWMVKGDGTSFSAASAGTDYVSPSWSATWLTITSRYVGASTNLDTALLNVDNSIVDKKNSGFVSWSGSSPYWSVTGGNVINLLSGWTGYIHGKKITWSGSQTVTQAANTAYLYYIDSSGVFHGVSISVNDPDVSYFQDNIVLWILLYDGTNLIWAKENHPYTADPTFVDYIHDTLWTVIQDGGANITQITTGTGTVATDRELSIVGADSVNDADLVTDIPDSGWAAITWNFYYTNASGKWIRYASQAQTPMVWNSAWTITALPTSGSHFSVITFYVSKDNINSTSPTYIAVIDGSRYTGSANATTAINNGTTARATNELTALQLAQLWYVIINNNASGGFISSAIVSKSSSNSKLVGGGNTGSASLVSLNTSTFTNFFSGSDTTVQNGFNTLDAWISSTNVWSTLVERDSSGNFSAGTITANLAGNASTVTTNANLTGDVTSVGNATTLSNTTVTWKLLTWYTSWAGTVASTDSILQAIQKLNGNVSWLTAAQVTNAARTDIGQTFTGTNTFNNNDNYFGLSDCKLDIGRLADASGAWIDTQGSTTNLNLNLRSKGTGVIQLKNPTTIAGSLNVQQWADVASWSTTNIGSATGLYINVTGTTTITAFDTVAAWAIRFVTFTGALLLTYNATSLILPSSANITTIAGDAATFVSLGSGNWKCIDYCRKDGTALVSSWGAPKEIRIRIPWELIADTSNYQGVFWRNNTWSTITISNVAFAVAIAAAWSGAAAAFNVYKSSGTASDGINTSAVNLFTSAVDLTTTNLSATNVPNTATVENGRWVSLRNTSSAWATNKASDCEVIITYS